MNRDDICCSGDCQQGRQCPRYRSNPPTESLWRGVDLFVAVLLVSLFAAFARGWL